MNNFAFILHPLETADVERRYRFAKYLPPRMLEWGLKYLSPKVLSHITGIRSPQGSEIEGWFVGCPLTARHFAKLEEEFLIKKIVAAGKLAESMGAMILGLGALTAVIGDGGKEVAKRLDIPVTTGNSYTVATAIQAALLGAEKMEIDLSSCKAAVVGATGSIGRVCSQILAQKVPHLTLVARNRQRLEALSEELKQSTNNQPELELLTEVPTAIKNAHLVISVSSSPDALIYPQDLMPGAVVCDPARPRDVSAQVAKKRHDVLIVDGGVVEVPGEVNFGFDFAFPPKTAYACMAETMILALEERFECYSLGRELQIEKVEEISRLASKHGFKLAGFRAFERAVSDQEIEKIKSQAKMAGSIK